MSLEEETEGENEYGMNHLNFGYSSKEVNLLNTKVKNFIRVSELKIEKIVNTEECTFESIIAPFADLEAELELIKSNISILSDVHPDKEVREVSKNAKTDFYNLSMKMKNKRDLYKKIVKAEENSFGDIEDIDKFYIRSLKLDFERNGLKLSSEKLKKVEIIQGEVKKNCIEFNSICGTEAAKTKLYFTKEELIGLYYLPKIQNEEGKYEVNVDKTSYLKVLEQCKNENTRREMFVSFHCLCKDTKNPTLLKETLKLRKSFASLMEEYDDDYTKYRLGVRMAKNKDRVKQFLTSTEEKVEVAYLKLFEKSLKMKRKETKDEECELHPYDIRYYLSQEEKVKETGNSVNEVDIRKYFSYPHVIEKVLSLFEILFCLQFEKVKNPSKKEVWHEDVEFYRVKDAKTKEIVSMIYIDIHSREGKTKNLMAQGLQPSCYLFGKKRRQIPIGVMICSNIVTPGNDTVPPFVEVGRLSKFCHELGHLLHTALSTTKYARFSGENVVFDFVEVPSNFFKYLSTTKEFLHYVSSHNEKSLTEEICEEISKQNTMFRPLDVIRLIYRSRFDIFAHESPDGDLPKLFSDLMEKSTRTKTPENLDGSACFFHIMHDKFFYDCGYYTYLWSDVIIYDLLSVFLDGSKRIEERIEEGKRLREEILSKGGERDPNLCVENFLGRKLSEDAFGRSLL